MYDLSSSNSKPVSNLRESLIGLYLLALFIFKLHFRLCMDPSGFICWGLGGGARGCDVMYIEWRAQQCSSGDTWSSCMTDSSVILNHYSASPSLFVLICKMEMNFIVMIILWGRFICSFIQKSVLSCGQW